MAKRMLDLFCGRFGWSKVFAARGWECVGIDLVRPPKVPAGIEFIEADVLGLTYSVEEGQWMLKGTWHRQLALGRFDFVCASSPCEQFSVHGMKCFHPNPPYPEEGIQLFNHTRAQCEASGAAYVMENVRAAQSFVGFAKHHCGPYYLWGNGVPPIMPNGIRKGMSLAGSMKGDRSRSMTLEERNLFRKANNIFYGTSSGSRERKELSAQMAEIPIELSTIVMNYAEGLHVEDMVTA